MTFKENYKDNRDCDNCHLGSITMSALFDLIVENKFIDETINTAIKAVILNNDKVANAVNFKMRGVDVELDNAINDVSGKVVCRLYDDIADDIYSNIDAYDDIWRKAGEISCSICEYESEDDECIGKEFIGKLSEDYEMVIGIGNVIDDTCCYLEYVLLGTDLLKDIVEEIVNEHEYFQ